MEDLNSADDLIDNSPLFIPDHLTLAVDDNREYVLYDFADPERHWHVSEGERVLLSCFTSAKGTSAREAISAYFGHIRQPSSQKAASVVLATVKRLMESGILVAKSKTFSPYTAEMISNYSRSRRIPHEVGAHIVRTGSVHRETKILDIATGTGEIARQLAEASEHVTGIDSSINFLNAAGFLARSQAHPPKFAQKCAHKLLLHDTTYDLVTLCQAFHWLNPALAVRGLQHVVKPDGLLFLVESKSMLPGSHPLRKILKYGDSDEAFVEKECVRQANWYSRLFDLLRRPGRLLRLAEVSTFRERRVFDFEFARAFFFEEQVRPALGTGDQPWAKLAELLSGNDSEQLTGDLFWLVMRFENVPCPPDSPAREISSRDIVPIA